MTGGSASKSSSLNSCAPRGIPILVAGTGIPIPKVPNFLSIDLIIPFFSAGDRGCRKDKAKSSGSKRIVSRASNSCRAGISCVIFLKYFDPASASIRPAPTPLPPINPPTAVPARAPITLV